MPEPSIAILANPMSGRDVRRLAARASNMTHEAKRDIVARVAVGADAMGVRRIFVMKEAFRIASGALEMIGLDAEVEVLDVGVTSSARDSVAFVRACRERGCDVMVTLGGDGTNRLVARTWPDVVLIPLTTGTNNVFPVMVEATAAGEAAGLVACGRVEAGQAADRCKLIHLSGAKFHDVAVIDALLLRHDHVGNYLPFDPDKMEALMLTRAEPAAVGTSPIAGMLMPLDGREDAGVYLQLGDGQPLRVPLSPGLFRTVSAGDPQRVPLGEARYWRGPGVIALDGDREHKLLLGDRVRLEIKRDGPWVLDVPRLMRVAAGNGSFLADSVSTGLCK